MMSHSSDDAVRALCGALDGRDVRPLSARLDDASLLDVPGRSGMGGDYQGRDAILGFLHRMAAVTGGTLRFETDGTGTSRGSALLVRGRCIGTRDGRPFDVAVAVDATLCDHVFRKLTIECADPSAWDAVWGRAP